MEENIKEGIEVVEGKNLSKLRTGLRLCAWAPIVSIAITLSILYLPSIIFLITAESILNDNLAEQSSTVLSEYIAWLSILFMLPQVMNIIGLGMCESSFQMKSVRTSFNTMKAFAIIILALNAVFSLLSFANIDAHNVPGIVLIAIIPYIAGLVLVLSLFINRLMCKRIAKGTDISGMDVVNKGYLTVLWSLASWLISNIVLLNVESVKSIIYLLSIIAIIVGSIMILVGWFMAAYASPSTIQALK